MVDAPDTLSALRQDLSRALTILDQRAPEYKRAKEYAEGRRAEIAGSRVAKRIIEQSEAAPISFAHIPVDVIADKIELASITAPEAQARAALEAWMDANDVDDESADWIHKACMFGDYYVIIDPTEEDSAGRAIRRDRQHAWLVTAGYRRRLRPSHSARGGVRRSSVGRRLDAGATRPWHVAELRRKTGGLSVG